MSDASPAETMRRGARELRKAVTAEAAQEARTDAGLRAFYATGAVADLLDAAASLAAPPWKSPVTRTAFRAARIFLGEADPS